MVLTEEQKQFIQRITNGAIQSYNKYDILPSLTMAQALLESNWGKQSIGNNIFGIKADKNWTGKRVKKQTREFINGKWQIVNAYFRDYDSVEDGIEDHGLFLTKKRYDKVRKTKEYKVACFEIWKAGYATDPQYPQKLVSIIEKYKFYEIDIQAIHDKESKLKGADNMGTPMGTPPKLITDLNRLHPKVKVMAELFLQKCTQAGLPIRITQTLRTVDTQKEYYSWGRTKINPFTKNMTKVTQCDGVNTLSRHQSGLAFDICINVRGKEYDRALLTKAGNIAESIGLTWGGRWKSFQDMPHIEIPPEQIDRFVVPNIKKEDDEMVTKGKFNVNGKTVELDRILKNNQNYVKLDDLKQMGLKVSYDASTKTVKIDFQ